MLASEPRAAAAVRALLQVVPLPVVTTFQATGILSRDMLPLFAGRVGLFHNQPADRLLDAADLVLTVGYDPIEYDEALWNAGRSRDIVHLDAVPCDIDGSGRPAASGRGTPTPRRGGCHAAGTARRRRLPASARAGCG
jgi:acetolactate synthase-1/2/3 large subunit